MGMNDIHSLSHTKWNCKYHIVYDPMEGAMFTLFVSTYSNITNLFSDLTGDIALELNRISKACKYYVSSLDEAIKQFRLSDTYKMFREEHIGRLYIYLLNKDATVERVDRFLGIVINHYYGHEFRSTPK